MSCFLSHQSLLSFTAGTTLISLLESFVEKSCQSGGSSLDGRDDNRFSHFSILFAFFKGMCRKVTLDHPLIWVALSFSFFLLMAFQLGFLPLVLGSIRLSLALEYAHCVYSFQSTLFSLKISSWVLSHLGSLPLSSSRIYFYLHSA